MSRGALGVRSFQTMVPMRDGARLNTFVFLPEERRPALAGDPAPHALRHRGGRRARQIRLSRIAWLPNAAEADARLDPARLERNIVAHGYAAVYQDCRGRHGSEGEDRVYADDAADGYDTLDWIAGQPWSNQRVGMSGSSAGATTTFAAASTRHPSLRAFFAQAGGSSIYDDVVYEGQSIEMERLWLWVAKNIPGLSASHREAVMRAVRHQRRRAGRGGRSGRRALHPARRGAPGRPAVYRLAGLAAPAADRLSGFRDLAAVSRRDHHPSGAGRVPRPAQFPPHDRHPWVSRHQLVRHLSDQRDRGVQRHPGAHRHAEIVDRPQRALFRLCRAISGRAIRISNGSTTG